jgi:transcriptional regulator with XRE-family HTH domain
MNSKITGCFAPLLWPSPSVSSLLLRSFYAQQLKAGAVLLGRLSTTAFREVLRKLRLSHGFSIEDIARKVDISESEALSLEQDGSYRPSPLLLHKLGKLYNIPQRRLAILCGAIREVPSSVVEQASRFAAMSDSFAKLTPDERRDLDIFVKFLRSER